LSYVSGGVAAGAGFLRGATEVAAGRRRAQQGSR
jgi:hypothetical protein